MTAEMTDDEIAARLVHVIAKRVGAMAADYAEAISAETMAQATTLGADRDPAMQGALERGLEIQLLAAYQELSARIGRSLTAKEFGQLCRKALATQRGYRGKS